jgi:hypothetical protein
MKYEAKFNDGVATLSLSVTAPIPQERQAELEALYDRHQRPVRDRIEALVAEFLYELLYPRIERKASPIPPQSHCEGYPHISASPFGSPT